jgi:hypothetical protein
MGISSAALAAAAFHIRAVGRFPTAHEAASFAATSYVIATIGSATITTVYHAARTASSATPVTIDANAGILPSSSAESHRYTRCSGAAGATSDELRRRDLRCEWRQPNPIPLVPERHLC